MTTYPNFTLVSQIPMETLPWRDQNLVMSAMTTFPQFANLDIAKVSSKHYRYNEHAFYSIFEYYYEEILMAIVFYKNTPDAPGYYYFVDKGQIYYVIIGANLMTVDFLAFTAGIELEDSLWCIARKMENGHTIIQSKETGMIMNNLSTDTISIFDVDNGLEVVTINTRITN